MELTTKYFGLLIWTMVLVISCFQTEFAGGLSLTAVRVERLAVPGNNTVLECQFDLQGERLYSVKWYKDGREFFRYLPRDKLQSVQLFPMEGVKVDKEMSNATQVTLRPLFLSSTGRYRCEVSAEAPSFQTVTDHGDMLVIALPKEGPKIRGGRPRYQLGDQIKVNCTSGRSRPPVHLMWFINGEQANRSLLMGPRLHDAGDGLHVTSLRLQFKVEASHFLKGDLKLKCLASIATIYYKSNEKSVEEERPQPQRSSVAVQEVKDVADRFWAERVLSYKPATGVTASSSSELCISALLVTPFLLCISHSNS